MRDRAATNITSSKRIVWAFRIFMSECFTGATMRDTYLETIRARTAMPSVFALRKSASRAILVMSG